MNELIYLLLRRLRTPLILVILVYAISVLGFTLVPGQDDEGNVWRMDFFHAFYFVSFMGSTIGFGEVPYPFTAAQRMWTMVCIYATVVAWLYAIGSTLALVQEPAFRRIRQRRKFAVEVSRLREPFYLVCGYGVTGSTVVARLTRLHHRVVVVDIDPERIDALELDELPERVPHLCADASLPDVLDDAGIQHPQCIGVLALTNHDKANLAIAIASKLLAPHHSVISRSETELTSANLASFGTDHIFDPYRTYAEYLAMAAHAPYQHLVYDWLVYPRHRSLASVYKRAQGRWIICGYGRFGRALYRAFHLHGVPATVVEPSEHAPIALPDVVQGVGTEARTLQEADIQSAVGVVAGTSSDADNLSIIMTARELKPDLITVVRQNLNANDLVFEHSQADFVMSPGKIVANHIMLQLKSPLLPVFIDEMQRSQDDVWAHVLLNRMNDIVGQEELQSWSLVIDETHAPAILAVLEEGFVVKLRTLTKHPYNRDRDMECFALALRRNDQLHLQPGELEELRAGDELLFCGNSQALDLMEWARFNYKVLRYLLTGEEPGTSWLARWWKKRRARTQA